MKIHLPAAPLKSAFVRTPKSFIQIQILRDVIQQILHGNFASHIRAIYVNFRSRRSQIRFAIPYQFYCLPSLSLTQSNALTIYSDKRFTLRRCQLFRRMIFCLR